MKRNLLISFAILALVLAACSKKSVEMGSGDGGGFSASEKSQREKESYLAYEHYFTVDSPEENLSKAYQNTLDFCVKDEKYGCTLLDSRLSTGDYQSARIKLRIAPEGVRKVLEISADNGKVVRESTHIEDLAQSIVDVKRRLEMLENQRGRLVALEQKATDDIDAMLKVASELSRIQSEIEATTGEKEFLLQRVQKDIVNIDFQVEYYRSFWRPIREALSEFSNHLSEGIGGTIIALAYMLPGIFVLIVVIYTVRMIRKKVRKNK